MRLIKLVPDLSDGALTALALLSTFAGNLLLNTDVGSALVPAAACFTGTCSGTTCTGS